MGITQGRGCGASVAAGPESGWRQWRDSRRRALLVRLVTASPHRGQTVLGSSSLPGIHIFFSYLYLLSSGLSLYNLPWCRHCSLICYTYSIYIYIISPPSLRRLHQCLRTSSPVSESSESRVRHGVFRSSPERRRLLSTGQETPGSQNCPDKASAAVTLAVRQHCRKWRITTPTSLTHEQVTRAERQAKLITLSTCQSFFQRPVKYTI